MNLLAKFLNHIVSDETKNKIRNKHLNIPNSIEHNNNISLAQKKLYAEGHVNNRKGWRKIGGIWYEPKTCNDTKDN